MQRGGNSMLWWFTKSTASAAGCHPMAPKSWITGHPEENSATGIVSGWPTIRAQGCKLSNVDPLGMAHHINSERIVAVDY
jgi:hypothetical protein